MLTILTMDNNMIHIDGVSLYKHQARSVYYIYCREKEFISNTLAIRDDTGTGKSFIIIGLIKLNPKSLNLIITSDILINQWVEYLKQNKMTFTTRINCNIYDFDVVLIKKTDIKLVSEYNFSRTIIDDIFVSNNDISSIKTLFSYNLSNICDCDDSVVNIYYEDIKNRHIIHKKISTSIIDIIDEKNIKDILSFIFNEDIIEKSFSMHLSKSSITNFKNKLHKSECNICFEYIPIENRIFLPCCAIILCNQCLHELKMRQQSCIICRNSINDTLIDYKILLYKLTLYNYRNIGKTVIVINKNDCDKIHYITSDKYIILRTPKLINKVNIFYKNIDLLFIIDNDDVLNSLRGLNMSLVTHLYIPDFNKKYFSLINQCNRINRNNDLITYAT